MAQCHQAYSPLLSISSPKSAVTLTSLKPLACICGKLDCDGAGRRGHWKSLYRKPCTAATHSSRHSTRSLSAYMRPGEPPDRTSTHSTPSWLADFLTRWSFLRFVMWCVRMRQLNTEARPRDMTHPTVFARSLPGDANSRLSETVRGINHAHAHVRIRTTNLRIDKPWKLWGNIYRRIFGDFNLSWPPSRHVDSLQLR